MKGTHQVAEGNAAAKQAVFPCFFGGSNGPDCNDNEERTATLFK